jgi:hypothetical protein
MSRKVYKVLVGKHEGTKPLRRKRRRWKDGIRMDSWRLAGGVWSKFNWISEGAGGGLL